MCREHSLNDVLARADSNARRLKIIQCMGKKFAEHGRTYMYADKHGRLLTPTAAETVRIGYPITVSALNVIKCTYFKRQRGRGVHKRLRVHNPTFPTRSLRNAVLLNEP
jgi:hypothetical protein